MKGPWFHIIICQRDLRLKAKQQMARNSLRDWGLQHQTEHKVSHWAGGGENRNRIEKGLEPWGRERVWASLGEVRWVSLMSHREEFSNSYSLKNKWRELSTAASHSQQLWKQAHVVAWCTIKALHIHHCAKKTYPKNSLLVTEHPYWNLSACPSASNDSSPAHNFTTSKQQCFLSSSIQFISSSQWGAFAIPTHFEPVLWFYLHGNNLLPWEGALIN